MTDPAFAARSTALNLLTRILGEGPLTPEVQRTALGLFEALIVGSPPGARSVTSAGPAPVAPWISPAAAPQFAPQVPRTAAGAVGAAASNTRRLVYVHGICRHVAGFSDPWWAALQPWVLPADFGDGTLNQTRLEVLWSDVITPSAAGVAEAITGAPRPADPRRTRLANEIREAMADRVDRHTLAVTPRSAPGMGPQSLADARGFVALPGIECVEDFSIYLIDEGIRQQVIDRFTQVVQPLLAGGLEVDVISHSWGTVVAYEALRQLEDAGFTRPLVRNLFTVGAALSLPPVKLGLRPANQDGHRPAMVRRWVNLNAHGDIVGGPLQNRPFQVDADFPNLDPFGCGNFLGLINPVCAHGSYFQPGNLPVNRDIFGRFIDQP